MWAASWGLGADSGQVVGAAAGRLAGVASTFPAGAGDFFGGIAAGRLAAVEGEAFEAALAGVAVLAGGEGVEIGLVLLLRGVVTGLVLGRDRAGLTAARRRLLSL
jgi:hypothetical protein